MKKHFSLAAITFLGGLVAAIGSGACGGGIATTTEIRNDGGAGSSSSGGSSGSSGTGSSSGSSGAFDAGNSGTLPDGGGGGPACSGTLPVDPTTLPWKSPFLGAGSCSQAELDALVMYVEGNPAATYANWKASVTNATCAACIFGLESAATWKPLLEDAMGALVEQNVGGCIAIASGKDNCGRAYQNWFDCRFKACADCPTGDSVALVKCQTAANKAGGGCKTYFDAVVPACTDQGINDAETACTGAKYIFEGPIHAQCIGLP